MCKETDLNLPRETVPVCAEQNLSGMAAVDQESLPREAETQSRVFTLRRFR